MHAHPRPLLALLVLIAAAAAVAVTVSSSQAPAAAKKTATKAKAAKSSKTSKKNVYSKCRLSEREQYPRGGKPTYNLTLKQKRTRCTTAKKVMVAFHKCRAKKSYRCTKKVLRRWKCTGKKDSSISTQFYGSFTCSWSVRRVHGSYQQNT